MFSHLKEIKIQESYNLFTSFKKVSRILLPTVSSQSSKLNQYMFLLAQEILVVEISAFS